MIAALESDKRSSVREACATALGKRREGKAVVVLMHSVQHDDSLDVRQDAAVALGRIGGPDAKEALRYFSGNSVFPQIRRIATEVLEEYAERLNGPAPKPAPKKES